MQYSVEEVGERGLHRQLRRAHRRPLLGVRQERHDPRPAEGLLARRDPARAVRCRGAQFQKLASSRAGRSQPPVALIGAVSQNCRRDRSPCARHSASPRPTSSSPREYAWCGAIGTAILEAEEPRKRSILRDPPPPPARCRRAGAGHPSALHRARRAVARPRAGSTCPRPATQPIPAYLGLDIGSVSTNVVVIDEFGAVIHDIYLRTAGRPIEAVQQGLAEVERRLGQPAEDSAASAPPAPAAS